MDVKNGETYDGTLGNGVGMLYDETDSSTNYHVEFTWSNNGQYNTGTFSEDCMTLTWDNGHSWTRNSDCWIGGITYSCFF